MNDLAAEQPEKLPSCRPCFWKKPRKTECFRSTTGSRAVLRGPVRPSRPRSGPHLDNSGRGHDRYDRKRIFEYEKQVQNHHRCGGRSRRRQWRHPRAGWPIRWMGAVCQRRQACLRLQFPRPGGFTVAATKLDDGKSTIRFEFAYDGGGAGKGGTGTLFVNQRKVAQGRIERTQPRIFSADETADVGIDLATPVVEPSVRRPRRGSPAKFRR